MSPESYNERLKDSKDPAGLRLKMVRFCLEHQGNVSLTAHTFACHPKTVRRWVARFQAQGQRGLTDQRGRHRSRPNKTAPEVEHEVLQLRRHHPWLGQLALQGLLENRCGRRLSTATINRILHEHGLIKPRRRRWRARRDLAQLRKALPPLRDFQIDVKHLNDIPNLWPFITLGLLPKYQYTLRDVITGLTFVSFAYELSIENSMRFAALVLEHLRRHGVALKGATVQSDWGTEFVGPTNAKKTSPFVQLLEGGYGITHRTIPVATPRFNGSVENFHGRIEDELYQNEPITSERELLDKTASYLLFYHFLRPHRGLPHPHTRAVTPYQFLTTKLPHAPTSLPFLPPVILDKIPLSPKKLTQDLIPHQPGTVLPDPVIFS